MAAGMPAWISKTFGFLGHPRAPQTAPTLAPTHELEQSSLYSKALPPLPPRVYRERQKVRAAKRSRTQSPALEHDDSNEQTPKAIQESDTSISYKDVSTQTNKALDPQPCHPIQVPDCPDCFGHNAAPTGNAPLLWTDESRQVREPSHSYREHYGHSLEKQLPSPARSNPEKASLYALSSRSAIDEMDVESQMTQHQTENAKEQEPTEKDADVLDGPPYTKGGARIVLANDGMKDCLALLLTSEMVAKISQIATRSRRLEYINHNLEKVKHQITSNETILECKNEELQDMNDQAETARVNEEIDNTQKCLEAAAKRADELEDERETLSDNLSFSREQSQEMFEDVLFNMGLLEVVEPEAAREAVYPGDLECSMAQIADQERRYKTEISNRDEEIISVEFDEVVRRTTKEEFEEKRNILITLEQAFEHRQEDLAADKAEYLRRVREGTCDLSQTEFDLRALEDFRRMTTDLKNAEEVFEDTFKRAKQLGVLDDHDRYYQQSVFSEWSGGYAMSMEHAMVGSAPIKRIGYWQETLDQSQDERSWGGTELEPWSVPDFEPDAPDIEDCDLQSVAISDSWSCVDWSRNRRRIDRWREIAGRNR
ncbi:MAG: hypothetical protein Q9166_000106 [cf. Caloplaca sp. 2 TL-2023]